MNPISYKQEMGDTERICTRESPAGSCSISHSPRYLFGSRIKITEQAILMMGQVVNSQMWPGFSILYMSR